MQLLERPPAKAFEFSEYQRAIFAHIRDSKESLVINAVAGSGKTTTIVEAAGLTSPMDDVGFLAFNKHIANELQTRLPSHVHASTFHSFGMAALRSHLGRKIDVNKNKFWDIAREQANGDPSFGGLFTSLYPLIQLINLGRMCRIKCDGDTLYQLAAQQGILGIKAEGTHGWNQVSKTVKRCLKVGVNQAVKHGVIDFTDMVWLPLFKRWVQPSLDILFIDEVQDLNRVQLDLARAIILPGGKVIAVGDPHQAIYAFMGAMSDSFYQAMDAFSAESLPLSICYRCPDSHIKIAQEYCPTIEASPTAVEGTVDYISQSSLVTELKGRTDALIISRKRAPLLACCIDLVTNGVPAKIRGNDVIGGVSKLITHLADQYGADYRDLLQKGGEWLDGRINQLMSLYGDQAESLIYAATDEFYTLESLYYGFPECTTLSMLRLKLESLSKGHGAVTLSTVHGAKGLEADWVGILDYESMPLSHPHMTEEQELQEINLQLIASTRSKQHLRFIA